MNRRQTCVLIALWGLVEASAVGGIARAQGVAKPNLIGGTPTTDRPEVGTVTIGPRFCSGTLIDARWVLTASQCWGHLSLFFEGFGPGTVPATFTINLADGRSEQFFVKQSMSLGFPIGGLDLMLLQLAERVPSSVARPALLATRYPSSGSPVTLIGYGAPNAGVKQVVQSTVTIGAPITNPLRTHRAITTPRLLTAGDAGGPMFVGTGATSRILGVGSQSVGGINIYGDVPAAAREVAKIILDHNIHVDGIASGRGSPRGCGFREGVFYGDVNRDGNIDRICLNNSSGNLRLYMGRARHLALPLVIKTDFCRYRNNVFRVGDFNGDKRTDLLCANMQSGRKQVFLAVAATDPARIYGSPDFNRVTPFCTHPGAELLIGDFNGDGRSDLFCHTIGQGAKWVDYASVRNPGELFMGQDVDSTSTWCTHAGARLRVADFNGDGLSDLLCHTKIQGWIDVKVASGDFRQWLDSPAYWSDHGQRFCMGARETLAVYDYTGNNRADLICRTGALDGMYEVGGVRVITSVGETTPFSSNDPNFGWSVFAWPRGWDVPWVTSNAAASPWADRY